jgi:purine-binding chemotaxis protein CheW
MIAVPLERLGKHMHMPPTNSISIVQFGLGPQQYGLPVEVVREVVPLSALVTLVGAPPTVCGLLNLRGCYLPILDGRRLMQEAPRYDLSMQIIIAGSPQPELGLLVDHVDGIATFSSDDYTSIHHGLADPLIESILKSEQHALILLNMAALRICTEGSPIIRQTLPHEQKLKAES